MIIRPNMTGSSVKAVAFSDLDGNLTYVNHSFVKLWGYSDEKELFGKPAADFWETKEKVNEMVAALRTRGVWAGNLIARRKDGSLKDIQLLATTVAGENGTNVCMMSSFTDLSEVKRLEEELEKREAALEVQTNELEEVNCTLKVLLKQRSEDKAELAKQILLNVKQLIEPCLEELKRNLSDTKQLAYLNILESNLSDIVSPFARKLSLKYSSLTPKQVRIAHFIKSGKTTREMAELLNVSERTVESHRQKIRMKIGIKNNKVNLRSHLMSI